MERLSEADEWKGQLVLLPFETEMFQGQWDRYTVYGPLNFTYEPEATDGRTQSEN